MSKHKPALVADNISLKLTKRAGIFGRKTVEHWALKNVSFQVRKGEVFGVIGRNGAGKTSLMKVLGRIISPDNGQLRTFGVRSCMLSLKSGFIRELTGRENAVLSGMLAGVKKSDIENRIPDIQAFSELGSWFDQPISTYSSGMRSRLGFAIAYHINSEIILIDEALNVGDAAFKKVSGEAMRDLISSDRTVVLVSHSMGTLEDLTDRVLWIDNGHKIMCGKTQDVLKKYEAFIDHFEYCKSKMHLAVNTAAERAIKEVLGHALEDKKVVSLNTSHK